MKIAGLLSISFCLILFSCRKDSFITSPDARITLSADTLRFDTVFTTSGSIALYFKIRNDNSQKLKISSVKLMGGNNSFYHINADGYTGPEINDLELNANDSTYVFVTVRIDPDNQPLPFIIQDSIQVSYNGNKKTVQLEAWGQNAHFFRNKVISADEQWNNDLPYVILGSLYVDQDATLTINKGCHIYTHADAPLIFDGTLVVNGDKDSADRVYFQGDRLDDPYKYFPAAWPGIYFSTISRDNILNYAVIKNAYQALALQEPSVNSNPKLRLNQCIIDNAYDAGILSLNSSVTAVNTLVSNCGKNLLLVKGGNYQFAHCTVAGYSNNYITHNDPVLLLTNYVTVNNSPVTAGLTAHFINCIFWGENGLVEDEVVVSKSGNGLFNAQFANCLWKVKNDPANITANAIINNQPPLFDSVNNAKRYYDFHLTENSPALEKGTLTGITGDLDGHPRPVGLPDLGCYERQ